MEIIKQNFFNRLSLNQKILSLLVIEILGFTAVMLVAFSQIYKVGNETKQMSSITIPLIESVNTIDENVYKQSISVKELFITVSQIVNQDSDEASFYEKFNQLLENEDIQTNFLLSNQNLRKSINDTESFVKRVNEEGIGNRDIILFHKEKLLSELYELRKVNQMYYQLVVNNLFAEINLEILTIDISDLDEISNTENSLMLQANRVSSELEEIINASKAQITYVERIAISYIVITSLIALLFVVSMVLVIVRMNISKPLQLLTDSINRYSPLHKVEEIEDEQNILSREDELGRMGRSFNRLKKDLWEQGEGLQTAKVADQIKGEPADKSAYSTDCAEIDAAKHAVRMYVRGNIDAWRSCYTDSAMWTHNEWRINNPIDELADVHRQFHEMIEDVAVTAANFECVTTKDGVKFVHAWLQFRAKYKTGEVVDNTCFLGLRVAEHNRFASEVCIYDTASLPKGSPYSEGEEGK